MGHASGRTAILPHGSAILSMFTVLVAFCNFLNKIGEIVDRTMKTKADVKTGVFSQQIASLRHFMEQINLD
jgi:hypothetical protein